MNTEYIAYVAMKAVCHANNHGKLASEIAREVALAIYGANGEEASLESKMIINHVVKGMVNAVREMTGV